MLDNLLSLDNHKRNQVAEIINNNFKYLLDKGKEMSLNEKAEENKISKIIKMILEFNRQQQDKD